MSSLFFGRRDIRRLLKKPSAGSVAVFANEISSDERHLGEQISLPLGRELADFCSAFNRMSKARRSARDNLELAVTERTVELRAVNRELTSALADIKTLSRPLLARPVPGMHTHYFPEQDRPGPPGEDEKPPP